MAERVDILYILGASHSGTTLLAMLLNAHPELASIGEMSAGGVANPDEYLCSCGQPVSRCAFWQSIAADLTRRRPSLGVTNWGTRLDRRVGRWTRRILAAEHRGPALEFIRDALLAARPGWKEIMVETGENYRCLAKTVLKRTGARILVDSSKIAHRLKFILKMPGLNVKVIHLVRDGRAVAMTYMRQDDFADALDPSLRRGGLGMQAAPTHATMSMAHAAEEFRRCIRSAEHLLANLSPSRWMRVHYEELCTNPDRTLGEALEFVNVDSGTPVSDFRSVEHHVIGNGMRLDTTSDIRLDDRWKAALTGDDLRVFNSVAGDTNRRYGYG